MSYRTGPGVPRSLGELWQFVRREFGAIQREAVRVDTKAQNALEDLTLISDDGKLHPNEKLQVVLRYAQLTGEQAGIEARATAYGITTEKTAYTTAISDLTDYLNGLNPLWTDATQVTPIDRAEWDSYWVAVTDARQALQNKIAERAGERAKWSQTDNDDGNRPEDGATVGATTAQRVLIENSSGLFLDAFSDPDAMVNWTQVSGAGFARRVYDANAAIGAGSMRIGDETGDDEAREVSDLRIPFDAAKLYRFEFKVYVSGTTAVDAKVYLGAAGFDSLGNFCNLTGADSNSNQYYLAASGAGGQGQSTVYVGYLKGYGASAGSNGDRTLAQPAKMHPNVRFFAPYIIANYPNKSGIVLVDYVRVDVIEVQDQRDLPHTIGNIAAIPVNPSFLSASDNGTTAKISIAAHTIQDGVGQITYNAGSITGLPFGTTLYVYCDDPGYQGGGVTYYATTTFSDLAAGTHRHPVGTITTPADGGGGTVPEDPYCVDYDTLLPDGRYLRDLQPGDLVECVDVRTGKRGFYPLRAMGEGEEECFALLTAEGAEIWQSESTPMDLPEGGIAHTPEMLGKSVYTLCYGEAKLSAVTELRAIGRRRVLKPDFGDRMFFAGRSADLTIATHNIRYKN